MSGTIEEKINKFLNEQGQAPGKLEIDSMSLEDAINFIKERDFDINNFPDFESSFKKAQRLASKGWTKRRNMPVIDTDDVRNLQRALKSGRIDIKPPYHDSTNPDNPFPEGLSGFEADLFLKRGLKDGEEKDDTVDVNIEKKRIGDLKPIQKQIYYDKSMSNIVEFGIDATIDFLTNKSFFISSSDNFIIDGHHRWLSGMLINPDLKVNVLEIDLPLEKLLPLSRAYSDAIGKSRNQ